jgi:hypothetical protein
MAYPRNLSLSRKSRPLCLIIVYCLVFAGLTTWSSPAQAQTKKKKKKAARIEYFSTDQSKDVTIGKIVTVRANVYDNANSVVQGVKVNWRLAPESEPFAALGPTVNDGDLHEVTVFGRTPEGNQAPPKDIRLTAILEDGSFMGDQAVLPYKGGRAAEKPEPSSGKAEISFDPAPQLSPGKKAQLIAKVTDPADKDAKVKWSVAKGNMEPYIALVPPFDRNTIDVIGIKGEKPPPAKEIPVVATYGTSSYVFMVPYSLTDGTGPQTPGTALSDADYFEVTDEDKAATEVRNLTIEPGQRITLTARKRGNNGEEGEEAAVSWEVPEEMAAYITKLKPADNTAASKAEFIGLYPKSSAAADRNLFDTAPEVVTILAQSEKYKKVVNIRSRESEVDVSWIVLPSNVVTNNYGRKVSDNFYCIEVVIGNNSGDDLLLTGMSFKLPGHNLETPVGTNPVDLAGNTQTGRKGPVQQPTVLSATKLYSPYAGMQVPVASYEVVRGMTGQRKLAFTRGTLINGLDALAQFLTGFNPFFHVASHARNFSQGINILGNPITKGLERLWPDPVQDEMNRLEQHTLHDDKVIANHTVFKTRVFFPKDALYHWDASAGKAVKTKTEDLLEIRDKLGKLVLAGTTLSRNEFQYRIRQDFDRAFR